jgi:isoleucyl-tRNA synthetase
MRKQNDFEMMDQIKVYIDGDEAIADMLAEYADYIKDETLAVEIITADSLNAAGSGDAPELKSFDLNGHKTGLGVEKVQ